jgi:penicillin-insensitive murein endopeptidase
LCVEDWSSTAGVCYAPPIVHGMARLVGLLGLLVATVCGAPEAFAQRRSSAHRERASSANRPPPSPPSASLGWANRGTLEHGRALREGDGVRYLPNRTLHWGTEELVGLLERVGDALHQRFGARVTIGDLSARHGGPVERHRSHQSGRDADVCFFARSWSARGGGGGAAVELDDYVSFDRNGRSLDGRYVFDTARNWALLDLILSDRRVRVERIFISAPLRQRLLAYGREHGADGAVLERAALTLLQPRGVSPHDNHFHVRIDCPAGDAQCREGIHRVPVLRRRPAARHDHARRGPQPPAPARPR